MYLLPTLAAGLVRCIHIDRLDKLSEGIGRQLREGAVPFYPLNKLLYILCLLFLFVNLLLQTFDLSLEVFLFLGVVFAHHGKAFIIQLSGNIVLINADKQTVKLSNSFLSLRQPFLAQPHGFLALHAILSLLIYLLSVVKNFTVSVGFFNSVLKNSGYILMSSSSEAHTKCSLLLSSIKLSLIGAKASDTFI